MTGASGLNRRKPCRSPVASASMARVEPQPGHGTWNMRAKPHGTLADARRRTHCAERRDARTRRARRTRVRIVVLAFAFGIVAIPGAILRQPAVVVRSLSMMSTDPAHGQHDQQALERIHAAAATGPRGGGGYGGPPRVAAATAALLRAAPPPAAATADLRRRRLRRTSSGRRRLRRRRPGVRPARAASLLRADR